MAEKRLVEAWAIVEVPQKHPIGLTTVPMRDQDVPDMKVCAVYVDELDARAVLSRTKVEGVEVVPCYVTYREPNEKPKD